MTTRNVVTTTAAPAAIGPYSQAIRAGGLLFTSGQIPIDPATGEMVSGGITEQATQVCRNLQGLLAAAGLSLENVIKTTVFLQDMGDFAAMNAVYAQYFTGPMLPARSTVQVAALPKGARVEIECVAVADSL